MPNHRRIESVALDESDRRLIEALERNARTSIADLARMIGLSPQSTSDRVKRLEDLGVIVGFTVRLDPAALGLGVGAYIRIRPAMGELQRVTQLLVDIPEIIECDRVTGEDCSHGDFLVKSHVCDGVASFWRLASDPWFEPVCEIWRWAGSTSHSVVAFRATAP